jgi:signal peptidase
MTATHSILNSLEVTFWFFVSIIASLLVLQYIASLPISPFNFKAFVVRSGSMEPTIHTGDLLFTRTSKQYSESDIITFADTRGQIITHRIVDSGISQNGTVAFTTKGDNNQSVDTEQTIPMHIVGKWWFSVPFLGYALVYAHSAVGIVVVTTFVVALLLSNLTWDYLQKQSLHAKPVST